MRCSVKLCSRPEASETTSGRAEKKVLTGYFSQFLSLQVPWWFLRWQRPRLRWSGQLRQWRWWRSLQLDILSSSHVLYWLQIQCTPVNVERCNNIRLLCNKPIYKFHMSVNIEIHRKTSPGFFCSIRISRCHNVCPVHLSVWSAKYFVLFYFKFNVTEVST